jgi:MFS family permease
MSEKLTGVAFAIFGFAMILMSPITGRLCERFQNRYILQCGLLVETLALFFAGPDFFLPPKIYLVLLAMFLLGMSESLILIPVTPEIIESCSEMIKDDLTKQFEMEQDSLTDSEVQIDVEEMVEIQFEKCRGVLTDKASVITNMTFAIGSIFGPILGGGLTDLFSYKQAVSGLCCVAAFGAFLNFSIIILPGLLCPKKARKARERSP